MGKRSSGNFEHKLVSPGTNQLRRRQYGFLTNSGSNDFGLEFTDREMLYGTGFFQFSDENFQRVFDQVIANLYFHGLVGVQKIGEEYVVYNVASFKQNLSGDVISGECTVTVQGDSKKIKATNEIVAFTKANAQMRGGFMFIDFYIEQHANILNSLYINRENTKNNIYVQVKNGFSKEKAEEIKVLKRTTDPVTVIRGEFEEIADLSIENQVVEFGDDCGNNLKLMDKMRGFRRNLDEKAERNLTSELQNSEYGFDFIEAEKIRAIKYLVDELNRINGTNITFKTLVEIKKEEQLARMETATPEGGKDNGNTNND